MRRSRVWWAPVSIFLFLSCGGRTIGSTNNSTPGDAITNDNSACLSSTCSGCCTPEGACLPGTADEACGVDSQECASCLALGGVCQEGQCNETETCGPSNCSGCCTSDNRCISGTTEENCGASGSACAVCGGECIEGRCCIDQDGDGYGEGCPLGDDCDDLAPGIIGACDQNGCPEGWVFVPSGDFIAGCLESYQYPCGPHSVGEALMPLDGFCIEPTETTVGAYRSCENFGTCASPAQDYPLEEGCNWSQDGLSDRDDHPINCVEWMRAHAYCVSWLGGDLPTEWQWEKAARGTDGRLFPWGDAPLPNDCSRCNYDYRACIGEGQERVITWPAGSLAGPEGDSPYGLKDMCGNLLEFTRSCLDAVGDTCDVNTAGDETVTRGGDAAFPWNELDEISITRFTTYYRGSVSPSPEDFAWQVWGFRCARNPWAGVQSPAQP